MTQPADQKKRGYAKGLVTFLDDVLAPRLRGLMPEEKRYWLLVPVTGVLAGLLARAFVWMLTVVQDVCWRSQNVLEAARGYVVADKAWLCVLLPTLAGAVILVLRRLLKGEQVEGTTGLIRSLAFKSGRLPFIGTLVNSVAIVIGVGAGASLGREGALMQSGAATGSFLARILHLKDHHVRVLLACGCAGGMAASYQVPIGASVFAMEVLLGSLSLELFGPIIVSCVIATAVSQVNVGSAAVYQISGFDLVSKWEIALNLPLGILLGFVSIVFIRVFSGLDELFRWRGVSRPLKPIVAMLVLGSIGVFRPEIFGNGFESVNEVLLGKKEFSIQLLFLLPLLKIFATALCRAGGIPGGLFTPSLFVGAMLGACFGHVAGLIIGAGSDPAAYALVGMGALLAGTFQAPITALLVIFELTHSYEIILPLMVACTSSALTSRWLQKASLFMEPLRREGITLPHDTAPGWIKQPTVREFLNPETDTVKEAEPFEAVVDKFLRSPADHDRLYVVNESGVFKGAVSLHEIKQFIRESENLHTVIAADAANPRFPVVYLDDPISRVVEILAESDAERLPVLENESTQKLVGSVSKRGLLEVYQRVSFVRREENGGS